VSSVFCFNVFEMLFCHTYDAMKIIESEIFSVNNCKLDVKQLTLDQVVAVLLKAKSSSNRTFDSLYDSELSNNCVVFILLTKFENF
jgi:hypothetical protein